VIGFVENLAHEGLKLVKIVFEGKCKSDSESSNYLEYIASGAWVKICMDVPRKGKIKENLSTKYQQYQHITSR
jgi:hypothetical protein